MDERFVLQCVVCRWAWYSSVSNGEFHHQPICGDCATVRLASMILSRWESTV